MGLESKLKTVKKYTWDIPDQYALRQYTKLTKNWEDKGRSRYSLAHFFNLSSMLGTFTSIDFGVILGSWRFIEGYVQGTDLLRNVQEHINKRNISEDGTIAEPPGALYLFKKAADVIRMPSLGFGLYYMGKGAFELIDYLNSSNPESLSNGIGNLAWGYSYFGIASSMYVKETNPKLLDKQPFWKSGYDWLLIKADDYLSRPVPKPVPIQ